MFALHRLPLELLAHTFTLLCEPPQFGRYVTDYTSPLLLGSVCRTWRQLAWTFPSLWKYIYIRALRGENQCQLLEEWLARSRSELLSVVVRVVQEETQEAFVNFDYCAYLDDPYAEPLMEIIVRDCQRWNSLEVDIPNAKCATIMGAAWGNTPHLRRLRARTLPEDLEVPCFYKDSIVPKLSHLYLEGSMVTRFGKPNPKTFQHIAVLYLNNMTVNEVAPMLTASSLTMQHFHLETLHQVVPLLPPLTMDADFPQLESLVLDGVIGDDVSILFPIFRSAPRLKKFEISINDQIRPENVIEFLGRLKISLEALTLWWDRYEDASEAPEAMSNALMKCVRPHSETLRHLAFVVPILDGASERFVKSFHTALTLQESRDENAESGDNESSQGSLPLLTSYEFYVFVCDEANELPETWRALRPVMNMVKSRWERSVATSRLHHLRLPNIQREQVLESLKEELGGGLQVEFVDIERGRPTTDWHFD